MHHLASRTGPYSPYNLTSFLEVSMRNGRGLAALLLVLSLAFLLTPTFRWAVEVALRDEPMEYLDEIHATYERLQEQALPKTVLQVLAQKAAADHDAKALAFVALHLREPRESYRAADQALAI